MLFFFVFFFLFFFFCFLFFCLFVFLFFLFVFFCLFFFVFFFVVFFFCFVFFLSFIVDNTNWSLNTIPAYKTSEFYSDWVYKFREIVGKPEFSDHFSKIVML